MCECVCACICVETRTKAKQRRNLWNFAIVVVVVVVVAYFSSSCENFCDRFSFCARNYLLLHTFRGDFRVWGYESACVRDNEHDDDGDVRCAMTIMTIASRLDLLPLSMPLPVLSSYYANLAFSSSGQIHLHYYKNDYYF